MSKRRTRTRREDTRQMTREQWMARWVDRYRAAAAQADQAYLRKHANSPYTGLERLRYGS